MTKIGVGIIGLGTIARSFHIPTYLKDDRSEIVAIVDRNIKKAAAVARSLGVENYYSNYQDLLDRDDVDVVDVCVPNYLHAIVTIDALQSGKDVLVEKPLALSVRDAKNMVLTAKKEGKNLGVVHNRRYYNVIRKTKKLMESGSLGEVYMAHFRSMIPGPYFGYSPSSKWFFNKKKSGGGVIFDQGIHIFDLIRWMLGEVRWIYGTSSSFFEDLDIDINAQALLRTKNECLCSVEMSWMSDHADDSIVICGTAGSLYVEPSFGYLEEIRGARNPASREIILTKTLMRDIKNRLQDNLEVKKTHELLIKDFVNAVVEDKEPPVTGEDGFKVLKIVRAMYNSIKRKGGVNLVE